MLCETERESLFSDIACTKIFSGSTTLHMQKFTASSVVMSLFYVVSFICFTYHFHLTVFACRLWGSFYSVSINKTYFVTRKFLPLGKIIFPLTARTTD